MLKLLHFLRTNDKMPLVFGRTVLNEFDTFDVDGLEASMHTISKLMFECGAFSKDVENTGIKREIEKYEKTYPQYSKARKIINKNGGLIDTKKKILYYNGEEITDIENFDEKIIEKSIKLPRGVRFVLMHQTLEGKINYRDTDSESLRLFNMGFKHTGIKAVDDFINEHLEERTELHDIIGNFNKETGVGAEIRAGKAFLRREIKGDLNTQLGIMSGDNMLKLPQSVQKVGEFYL